MVSGADRPRGHERKPLKVACLGGGYHSAVGRCHHAALAMDRRFEVVAGCFSLDPRDNEFSAAMYGVPPDRTYASLAELLRREAGQVQAFVILTPTDQHAGHVVECLDNGIPVICEKALAVSGEEIRTIGAKLEATSGFLAVTYNYLGYPMVRELRAMIAAGELGNVKQIQIEMPQEGFIRRDAHGDPVVPQDWRLRDHEVPTISLDLGVHVHSIVSYLTEQTPAEVVALAGSLGNFRNIVDNVVCIARYSGDLQCTFWYSKTALGYRNGLKVRVFGDKAGAEWLQENPEVIQFSDCFGKRSLLDRASAGIREANNARYSRFKAGHPAGFIEAFANYYADVADALEVHLNIARHAVHPSVCGLPTALEGITLLEAISRSAKEMRWVKA